MNSMVYAFSYLYGLNSPSSLIFLKLGCPRNPYATTYFLDSQTLLFERHFTNYRFLMVFLTTAHECLDFFSSNRADAKTAFVRLILIAAKAVRDFYSASKIGLPLVIRQEKSLLKELI